jgi:hypothetical protein
VSGWWFQLKRLYWWSVVWKTKKSPFFRPIVQHIDSCEPPGRFQTTPMVSFDRTWSVLIICHFEFGLNRECLRVIVGFWWPTRKMVFFWDKSSRLGPPKYFHDGACPCSYAPRWGASNATTASAWKWTGVEKNGSEGQRERNRVPWRHQNSSGVGFQDLRVSALESAHQELSNGVVWCAKV